ncbi:MAG: GAF domain-containing protein [Bowdeniella nasicola]|nr:GAF domain-containing protein [Bowdeniella nasicola]
MMTATTGREPLLSAALDLTSTLDLPQLLQRFVDLAAELTGAQYAALGVLDAEGTTVEFVHHGVSDTIATALGHPPTGAGLLGAIPAEGYLLLDDLTTHPAFRGFPASHPTMRSFLGVPVTIGSQVYGRLYLAEKAGGFDARDAEQMQLLAEATAVAVENSQLYSEARARERWIQVSQDITTCLLEGTEEEEALQMIADRLRDVAKADTACIVLPSVGESWACEIASGMNADQLIGAPFTAHGRALRVLQRGNGLIVDSLQRTNELRLAQLAEFGSALYAPMIVRGARIGVLLLLRAPNRPVFVTGDLSRAEALAQQAALALELAAARHAEDFANLLQERARIGRDLHDLAIQQLFATGMQLEAAREQAHERDATEVAALLESALSSVDASVRQIRSIVHRLNESTKTTVIAERLRQEASLGRTALGYAPSLVLQVDDEVIADFDDGSLSAEMQRRIPPAIADEVIAVVREGLSNAARHAHANSVQVQVRVTGRQGDGSISVEVTDDGVGFHPGDVRRSGLDNLAARARTYHGTLEITAGPDRIGTTLLWQVPLCHSS